MGLTNKASVTSDGRIGGIIGVALNTTKINKVENAGTIIGSKVGGVIGNNRNPTAPKINCAYTYTDVVIGGAGFLATMKKSYRLNTDEDGVTALSTQKFKNQSSFKDWDFSTIWKMGNKYPVLR